MRQNLDRLMKRYPSLYRHDLLDFARRQRGWSQRTTATKAGACLGTINKIFKGKANNAKVYPIAHILGVDWSQLHNLELSESEFHLAVRNGKAAK